MRPVDIGVRHDDDPLVSQIVGIAAVPAAAAQGLNEISHFLVGADLVGGGGSDVQDLASDRKNGLSLSVAGLLGGAAGAVAFYDKQFSAGGIVVRAVGKLARKAELAMRGGGLALDLTFGPALESLVHPIEDKAEQRAAPLHMIGEKMVEMVADRIFDQPRSVRRG